MPTIKWKFRLYKFPYTKSGQARARNFIRKHPGAKTVRKGRRKKSYFKLF